MDDPDRNHEAPIPASDFARRMIGARILSVEYGDDLPSGMALHTSSGTFFVNGLHPNADESGRLGFAIQTDRPAPTSNASRLLPTRRSST